MANPLRVVVLKPSKYATDGFVERFRRGFMPNNTVPYVGRNAALRRNGAADYAQLRRSAYDLDLVPLPSSLHLSAQESQLQALSSYQTFNEQVPA